VNLFSPIALSIVKFNFSVLLCLLQLHGNLLKRFEEQGESRNKSLIGYNSAKHVQYPESTESLGINLSHVDDEPSCCVSHETLFIDVIRDRCIQTTSEHSELVFKNISQLLPLSYTSPTGVKGKPFVNITPHLGLMQRVRDRSVSSVNDVTGCGAYVFVTGSDSRHFSESRSLVASVQRYFPRVDLIYYNLGLSRIHIKEVGRKEPVSKQANCFAFSEVVVALICVPRIVVYNNNCFETNLLVMRVFFRNTYSLFVSVSFRFFNVMYFGFC